MSPFKPSVLTLALVAAGMSAVAYAAEENAPQQDEAQTVEVIEVRGIRRSLAAAQAEKMDNTSIVEAISAEDIGKLPDNSIAESLARLPGLTTQRLNGRANVVSIRGLAPDFTTATLNGREQVTVNENRGVEFDQYPSELINSAVVYKTPDASVMAQAIGGTVDLQTVRPLAHGERTIVVNGRYEENDMDQLNPDVDNTGYRFSFSYIDQFMDDTLGVALGLSSMSSPSQFERTHIWGYPETGAAEGNPLVMGGYKPYVQSSELERDGLMAVIEFAPNDRLHSVLDVFYTDFQDNYSLRGAEIPLAWSAAQLDPNSVVVEDGLVTEGTFNGVKPLIRNDYEDRDADLAAVGWNISYILSDLWSAEADLSYSKANSQTFSLESYSGIGRGYDEGLQDTFDFVMTNEGAIFNTNTNYADPALVQLGNPQGWGFANGIQDGFINDIELEDELAAFRLSAARIIESGAISQVEFGVNYTNREKTKDYQAAYLQLKDNAATPVPSEYLLPSVDLGFIGIGDLLSFDSRALYNSGNFYNEFDALQLDAWRQTKSWSVKEEVMTPYVKADILTELWELPLKGNVGVQGVYTDQSSDGYGTYVDENGGIQVVPLSGGSDYWEILPSLNLSLEVADSQYVRLGIARTLARARMDQMNASLELSYNADKVDSTDIEDSPWGGSGGNPELEPWMAWQYDLSYENYFSDTSYFAAAIYYKDLENYIFQQQTIGDFTGIPVAGEEPALREGYVSIWQNGQGGYIWGGELTLSVTGDLLHDALSGFGASVNYSYTDSEVKETSDSEPLELPGLSEDVINSSVYYEDYGFQVRVSARYRSEFLGEVSGLSLARDKRYVDAETLVDAQIGYDFSYSGIAALEGLTLLIQGLNLTDEPFKTYENDDKRLVRDYQSYGRTILVGGSYTF
ncbi:TonB-dependent receptor [Ferrimonas balearica]|uniref:TonB-dependent receptor n=1 Tax=Ferrimonas balearica TaxID=44012 RepID=UPI001C5835D1|nr:TonB-dependent receptor [Ferrimonas balearica]MBW3138212.1 TonB-dependent receptor [Ferrimonas balearica]MBY6105277.1 TonB-dependent receptor [Ferrimonas balearica]MBY6225127.1 TonB-dependent receptor [Ferrimonas balearica]